jgi:hypothetical protein
MGQLLAAFGYFDDACWFVVRTRALFIGTPFICLCRFSDMLLGWWLWFDQCISLARSTCFLLNKEKCCVHPLDAEAGSMLSISKKT